MNENIAFNGRKIKRSRLVHACFTVDDIVLIKKSENSKPLKVFHMKNLRELFPDFNFDVDEDLFHDASQDTETLVIKVYFWIIFTFHLKEWGKIAFGRASA